MKDYIFKLFYTLFSDQISKLVKSSQIEYYETRMIQNSASKKHAERVELEMLVGQPVIAISNEWKNPIVGFGSHIIEITKAKIPMLVIKDYVSGEEFMPLGWTAHFTQQRLHLALTLNPFELSSLLYKNECYDKEFSKQKSGVRDSYEEVIEKLKNNGFFELLEQKNS